MSMSMNIHRVGEIKVGAIEALELSDGSTFYTRSISVIDKDGNVLIRLDPMSDDGYKLLIEDAEITSLTAELPLLKAA